MPTYRVESGGEVVWSGDVETTKDIPAEYRGRPASTAEGEAHAPANIIYCVSPEGEDVVIAVQLSLREALDEATKANVAAGQAHHDAIRGVGGDRLEAQRESDRAAAAEAFLRVMVNEEARVAAEQAQGEARA